MSEKKLKIREDIDLKELEKFGFEYWDKEDAKVAYFRFMPMINRSIKILIEIYKDRTIDFQLPIGCQIEKNKICINDYVQDLIQADLVIKE